MSSTQAQDQLLLKEVERAGGGYLRVQFLDGKGTCRLLIHEGSELNPASSGVVDWHAWDLGDFNSNSLLELVRAWPTFEGQSLDERVGIWFGHFQRQKNRKTAAIRWKAIDGKESYYPYLFPWHELQQLNRNNGSQPAVADDEDNQRVRR